MAGTPLNDKQIAATLAAQKKHPGNDAAAARAIGISGPTYRNRLDRMKVLGHKLVPAVESKSGAALKPEDVRQDRRERDTVSGLKKQVDHLAREANKTEDLRKYLFGVISKPLLKPALTVVTKPPTKGPGTPILFFSDAQWGEVIEQKEMSGVNAFNLDIARRRYKLLIERSIDLCKSHMVNPSYDGIVYLRGGDMVSGDIHDELRETNEANAAAAARDLVAHEVAGIEQLAHHFGKVHVISVPGNHGRTTKKPHAKKFVEENWDTVTAWWLEDVFTAKKDSRVSFITPMSGDAVFKVYNWTFLLTHGDRIGSRGGQGMVGPAATITRGMKKTVDYYRSIGTNIDEVFVGHFHTRLRLEYGFANGSLPGANEYAKSEIRAKYARPEQWLLFVHPKYGVTCEWPIYLDERRSFSDTISDLGGKR